MDQELANAIDRDNVQLFSPYEIEQGALKIANEVKNEYGNVEVFMPILTGGMIFAADLLRMLYALGLDPIVVPVQARRIPGGYWAFIGDHEALASIKGKRCLLVDGIYDTGGTMTHVQSMLRGLVLECRSACLLLRESGEPPAPDYHGLLLPGERFIHGYGMDDDGKRRGAPQIMA